MNTHKRVYVLIGRQTVVIGAQTALINGEIHRF